MSAGAIVFLLFVVLSVVNSILEASKEAKGNQKAPPQDPRLRRQQYEAERSAFQREFERQQRVQPVKARIVTRPAGNKAAARVKARPVQAAPAPQRVREHHLHSKLEQPHDLSKVDDRHLARRVDQHSRQVGLSPQSTPRARRPGQRGLKDTEAAQVSEDAQFDPERFCEHLTPIQKAFVFGEVIAKPAAFQRPRF